MNPCHDLVCSFVTSWPRVRSRSITSGIGSGAGSEPAEYALNRPPPSLSRMASAMIERAEFLVHRNSTLKAGVMPFSSATGGEQTGDVAAQLRPAAATGLGQEPKQSPQPRDPHGVDDLPALPGGLREARSLERRAGETTGSRRARPSASQSPPRVILTRPARSAAASGRAWSPELMPRRRPLPLTLPCFQIYRNIIPRQGWPPPR